MLKKVCEYAHYAITGACIACLVGIFVMLVRDFYFVGKWIAWELRTRYRAHRWRRFRRRP